MKKTAELLLIAIMLTSALHAQVKNNNSKGQSKPFANLVSAGIGFPLGKFSQTHFAGAGIQVSRSSPHRFGRLYKKPSIPVAITALLGIDHYLGRKDANDFRFFGLTYVQILAGLLYQPFTKANFSFTAGPAIRIYHGHSNTGLALAFQGNLYENGRIVIGPSIEWIKHRHENEQWTTGIRAGYCF